MKVNLSNLKVMELYGAVLGAQKQASQNDRRFNYAMERNAALLKPAARAIRRLDAENLKGYYDACDKEEALAKETGIKPDEQWMERLKGRYIAEFEKNKKSMLEVREVELYCVKFAWLPNCPGFMQRALGPVIEQSFPEELCQPEIPVPVEVEEDVEE